MKDIVDYTTLVVPKNQLDASIYKSSIRTWIFPVSKFFFFRNHLENECITKISRVGQNECSTYYSPKPDCDQANMNKTNHNAWNSFAKANQTTRNYILKKSLKLQSTWTHNTTLCTQEERDSIIYLQTTILFLYLN